MLNPEKYLDEVELLEFGVNHEARCACVLLLDTSSSMKGEPIKKLNEGYKLLLDTLKKDRLAVLRVELSVIVFGGRVQVVQEFATVDKVNFKPLVSDGSTPMGEAIKLGVAKLAERKKLYEAASIRRYRPWMFMVTDGEPTDEWKSAASLVREREKGKHLSFCAVGVEGANMSVLKQMSVRSPVHLKGLDFTEMFTWLSTSLSAVADSGLGANAQLRPVDSWGSVST